MKRHSPKFPLPVAPLAIAGLIVCIAVLLLRAAPAHGAFPGFNGKFVWDGLSFADSNGRGFKGSVSGGDYAYPHWSPDGAKLVFSYPGTEDPALYHGATSNADGSGFQDIGVPISDPSWSPNGSRIVFRSGAGPSISVINADGTGRVQITSGASDFNPSWSPDGTKIAFDRDPGGNRDIYVMNTDGSNVTRLTTDPAADGSPNWSPDGQRMAFDRCHPGCDIYVMNADGTGQTATTSDGGNYGPVWSPDGMKIAFGHGSTGTGSDRNGSYTMNPDGTNRQFLLPIGAPSDWQPCTSPCPPPAPPSFDTPRWAGSLSVSLVPNYRQTISASQCQARGGTPSTHGAPLSLASCNPPGFVPGTEAHMGNTGSSYVRLNISPATLGSANSADVNLDSSMTDIVTSTGADYLPDPIAVDVRAVIRIRITDTNNGSSHIDPATVQDFDLSVPEICGPVAQHGAFCRFGTSMNALTPGTFKDDQNNVLQLFRVRMYDCGPDGMHGNADDRIFATQGIYIP